MNKKPFIPLSLKMAFAVVLGLLLAACVVVMCFWVKNTITMYKYQSDAAIEKNLDELYENLETYIRENEVKGTDTEALSNWMKTQEYVYLYVYDNNTVQFEAGWWLSEEMNQKSEEETEDNVESSKRIDEDTFTEDVYNRIVTFADRKYYVSADLYKEYEWERLMSILTVVLAFITLLATILIYNRMLLKRISLLSGNIQKISDGDLEHRLFPLRNDELGELTVSVETMRNSIIKKYKDEKAAWEANQQLITEMSHDIRTPLTSMIGYLDIIEGKKYKTEAELDKYVSACRDKAFQLKDLSDKLFQYFLVYGSQKERLLERFDANILLQQLLMEHSAELISQGYTVDLQFDVPEVGIMVDLSGIRRLFNNIFSNVTKYADAEKGVRVRAVIEECQLVIVVENWISEASKKVESNKIGLKTCEKICSAFKGRFVYAENGQKFFVWVYLPIAELEAFRNEEN